MLALFAGMSMAAKVSALIRERSMDVRDIVACVGHDWGGQHWPAVAVLDGEKTTKRQKTHKPDL